ncbi:alpha/beta fold hydrolase [Kitasatospora sp. NBC_01560]|uniref:alpha/beta hydrolase n=1 Tax=Kitasatospora sp. NBC_01560 TaxID=2975965 RepID=UPI00386DF00E
MTELWVATSGGHELHVQVVRPPDDVRATGTAVLLLPGLFSDGSFFLGSSGRGPAAPLLAAGHTVYLASLRGHGRSRRPEPARYDWNFDTYVRHDVPDLVRAVAQDHPGALVLLAHSMAGYAALAALGVDPALQDRLRAVVTLASAVNDYTDGGLGKRAQLTFATVLSAVVGRFPARALRQGRWDEPAGLMKQFTDWAPARAFRSADGATDYWAALGAVRLPALVGVGAGDTFHASPARARKLAEHLGGETEFTVFGRANGQDWDPGHFDVVRGSRAEQQILPAVLDWLRKVLEQGPAAPTDGPRG